MACCLLGAKPFITSTNAESSALSSTNFCEISSAISSLEILSAKCQPFCPEANVLRINAVPNGKKMAIHHCQQLMKHELSNIREGSFLILVGNETQRNIYALSHWGRVMHRCITKLGHHWFRQWLVAWPAPSHCLNQWWNIVNWTTDEKVVKLMIFCFHWSFKISAAPIHGCRLICNLRNHIMCMKCSGINRYQNICRQNTYSTYQWLSARLQYLQCISNKDTAVLH